MRRLWRAGASSKARRPTAPRTLGPVDRIIVATGQRPDLSLTRELRLDLDPWIESAKALGPMIDPNLHSCGSVPPHGHRELSHPEPGFYTVGVKSYGRAPTFLMVTGYEQVRSVSAAIAGDMEAADDVRLVLPETGVCSTQVNAGRTDVIGLLRRAGPGRGGRLLRCGCGRQGREEVWLRLRGCRLRSDVPVQRSRGHRDHRAWASEQILGWGIDAIICRRCWPARLRADTGWSACRGSWRA